jgi:hypothetical protein
MNLAKPHRIEADSIAEFYLCEDVFISLRLRISGSTWQLVEESETHAFLPNWRVPDSASDPPQPTYLILVGIASHCSGCHSPALFFIRPRPTI